MRNFILAATVLVFCVGLLTVDLAAEDAPGKDAKPGASPTFPATWAGVWKGECELVRGGTTTMRFPMELHIAPREEGRYSWTIVYGEGAKRQERPYELLPVKAEPTHFRIDEKNGIVLDAFYEKEHLHNRFGIGEVVIEATYAREGDALTVSLTTFGAKPLATTGGKGKVPPVTSYALRAVQRGVLRRTPR